MSIFQEFQYWLEQNPQILNALLPQQQQASSSARDMNEVMLTGQPIVSQPLVTTGDQKVEGVTTYPQETVDTIDDQDVSGIGKEIYDQETIVDVDNQNISEPVGTQGVTEPVNIQDVDVIADQDVTKVINSANQGVDEVVNIQSSDVIAEQQTTGKVVDNQEEINKAINEEVINSQRVDEAVASQIKEVINDQEVTELITSEGVNKPVSVQGPSKDIDSQQLVNNDQAPKTDQSGVLDSSQADQSAVLLPVIDIPQDSASHELVGTLHHSKSLQEQEDIWQSSFMLTQPSCIKCPGELRSLWREPSGSKASTQPLQHYTSSLNLDQVSYDVIITSSQYH